MTRKDMSTEFQMLENIWGHIRDKDIEVTLRVLNYLVERTTARMLKEGNKP